MPSAARIGAEHVGQVRQEPPAEDDEQEDQEPADEAEDLCQLARAGSMASAPAIVGITPPGRGGAWRSRPRAAAGLRRPPTARPARAPAAPCAAPPGRSSSSR